MAQPGNRPTMFGLGREVYLIAILAAAYGNLYYMQVMVEIYKLPALVVFVGPDKFLA